LSEEWLEIADIVLHADLSSHVLSVAIDEGCVDMIEPVED
jgi:hypothetical protein